MIILICVYLRLRLALSRAVHHIFIVRLSAHAEVCGKILTNDDNRQFDDITYIPGRDIRTKLFHVSPISNMPSF